MSVNHVLNIIVNGEDRASGVLRGIGGAIGGVGKAILSIGAGAAIAGIAAIGTALNQSMQEAMAAEAVQAQLNAVLASTKGAAGMSADAINTLATSLSEVTRFDDEAIVSGQNLLLTFTKIGKDVFPEATEVMLDMSQALGQDLKSSAIQLGKALQDPELGMTALRRVGVNFTKDQVEMVKAMVKAGDVMGAQKFILAELKTEFGGAAKAAGQTFAGQMDIMRNKLANVKEEVGMALLPALGQLTTTLGPVFMSASQAFAGFLTTTVIPAIRKVADWVTANWPAIQAVAEQVFGRVRAVVGEVVGWVTANWPRIQAIAEQVFGGVRSAVQFVGGIIQSVMGIVTGAIGEAGNKSSWLGEMWQKVQAIIAAVVPPIRDIVMGVFSAIQVFLAEHGPAIKQFVGEAWEKIGQIINTTLQVIQAIVVPIFTAIGNFIKNNQAEIKLFLDNTWTFIKTIVETVLNTILGIVRAVLALLKGDWQGAWEEIKGIADTLLNGIKTIVETALSQMLLIVGTNLDAIKQWFIDRWNDIKSFLSGINLADIGASIIGGLINGIKSAGGALLGAIKEVVGNAIQAAWNAIKGNSPSRVFMDIGASMGQGLIIGINGMARSVEKAAEAMMPDLEGRGSLAFAAQGAGGRGQVGVQNRTTNVVRQGDTVYVQDWATARYLLEQQRRNRLIEMAGAF